MKKTSEMKASPGKLVLEEVRQRVKIGCTPQERAWPQLCHFNIELHFDMDTCAASDDINHTIDYMQVLACLHNLATQTEWCLIEAMSASICSFLLQQFAILQRVQLSVRKVISENNYGVSCHYQLERV